MSFPTMVNSTDRFRLVSEIVTVDDKGISLSADDGFHLFITDIGPIDINSNFLGVGIRQFVKATTRKIGM